MCIGGERGQQRGLGERRFSISFDGRRTCSGVGCGIDIGINVGAGLYRRSVFT